MPLTKRERAERQVRSLETLRELLQPGDNVYTVLKHRAASGMSRRLIVLAVTNDPGNGRNKISNISWDVAMACGERINLDTHEITVTGCGFDAGFQVVYDLGRRLWPDGTPEPHSTRNGEPDRDGGYALKHEWL